MADSLGTFFGYPWPSVAGNYGVVSIAIADTTSKAEFPTRSRGAITCTRVGIRVTSITGTSPLIQVGLQGLDSSGNPDGVYLGGGTPASAIVAPSALGWTANTFQWVNLDNSVVLTRGQRFCVVAEYSSGTVDVGNTISITATVATGELFRGSTFAITNLTGVRTRVGGRPVFAYGSATVAYGSPWQSTASQAFNVNGSPDEYGLAFTVPAICSNFTISDIRFEGILVTTHTVKMSLYLDTATLQTFDYDTDDAVAASIGTFTIPFTDTNLSVLTPGVEYILALAPQSTTNQTLRVITQASADDWAAHQGGISCRLASRTDSGAWSFDATKRPLIAAGIGDMSVTGGSSGESGNVRFNAGFN